MHRESFWLFLFVVLLYGAGGAIAVGALSGLAYAFGAAITGPRATLAALCGAALGGMWLVRQVWTSGNHDGTEMACALAAYAVVLSGLAAGVVAVLR